MSEHAPAGLSQRAALARAVEDLLAARVAAAWDEGYSEGRLDESINSETDNPYRAPGIDQS